MPQTQSFRDQVTASNGNMHNPVLLERGKPHEDRLYTVLHVRCFHVHMPVVGAL